MSRYARWQSTTASHTRHSLGTSGETPWRWSCMMRAKHCVGLREVNGPRGGEWSQKYVEQQSRRRRLHGLSARSIPPHGVVLPTRSGLMNTIVGGPSSAKTSTAKATNSQRAPSTRAEESTRSSRSQTSVLSQTSPGGSTPRSWCGRTTTMHLRGRWPFPSLYGCGDCGRTRR